MPYTEYQSDVEYCKNIHRAYGKSFYRGTVLFPRPEREATCVLYAFFRFSDEYVDTIYQNDLDRAREKLSLWRELWRKAYNGQTYEAQDDQRIILRATAYVFQTYHIPFEYSESFLDAMLQDTYQARYKTYADLEAYMYGSASVVGLMMTYIMCASSAQFMANADYRTTILQKAQALGEAFQMTNFLRDVGEDIRDRGRIYIPLEDLQAYGVSEDDIVNQRMTPAFISLMQFEVKRTQMLYTIGDSGIPLLPAHARKAVYLARVLYLRILNKIEEAKYDVFTSRLRVSSFEKICIALGILIKSNIK